MIVTDESIFRNPYAETKSFGVIPYQFNINHYIIRQLWLKYKKASGVPETYFPSDKHRLHFESQLIRIIKSGQIEVHIKNSNAYVPNELKEVVYYEQF